MDIFRSILEQLQFGEVTEQDIQTLIDACDKDGNGKININDFRRMVSSASTSKEKK